MLLLDDPLGIETKPDPLGIESSQNDPAPKPDPLGIETPKPESPGTEPREPFRFDGYSSPFMGRLSGETAFYNPSPAAQLQSQFRYSEQTPDSDAQLSRAQADLSATPLAAPGTMGQAYTAVMSPPRSFQEMAEVIHGIEQNDEDTTAALRAMAKRHGLDPDSVAKLPPLWEKYLQGAGDVALDTGLSF